MPDKALIMSLILLIFFVTQGCETDQPEVLVFAGASLNDVLEQQGNRFTEQTGVRVAFHFGGSTELARQIMRGAPADVFIPAGSTPMDLIEQAGLLTRGTRVDLLKNELVLVKRSSGQGEDSSIEAVFLGQGRISIADPDLAPAGYYARESLQHMGVWDDLVGRLILASNVRTTLSYVKADNVDVGIVYLTDAIAATGVDIIDSLPQESYPPIIYPGAVITQSALAIQAEQFLQFLQGNEALEIFHRHGFKTAY